MHRCYTGESSRPLIKAEHASELSVVFAHPELNEFTGRAYGETFSETVRKMRVQLAKTGNPSRSKGRVEPIRSPRR